MMLIPEVHTGVLVEVVVSNKNFLMAFPVKAHTGIRKTMAAFQEERFTIRIREVLLERSSFLPWMVVNDCSKAGFRAMACRTSQCQEQFWREKRKA